MNYEDKTDFELEVMVADFEGIKWHSSPKNSPNGHWLYSNKYKEIEGDSVEKPKYCTNPSDAWPIIQQTWVTLMSPSCRGYGTLWDNAVMRYKCGKLRAAMICFLKMKESQNG